MSIATLKKKSQRYFNPISSGKLFSINNNLRNQGWVGQTSLSRSNVRALKNGTDYVGHGGCCGTYPISNLTDGIFTNPNPEVITSTKNTNGLILSKIIHPTRVYNNNLPNNLSLYNVVQKFDDDHLRKLKLKHTCIDSDVPLYKTSSSSTNCCKRKIIYHQFVKKHQTLSSQDYIASRLLVKNCLPTPPCLQPFPTNHFSNSKKRCSTNLNYSTPEQAKSAGVLPSNWLHCKVILTAANPNYCAIYCQ